MLVLSGLVLGMLLAALDLTIMGAASKTIADRLHGQTIQAWVTTAYLITSTISTPLYGKLSDLFGRKSMYLTAISLFLIGSVASGFAQSMYQLAAFRAVQGLGAGGLMSLAIVIIADIVPPRDRGKYQGYLMSVWGISSVLGPLIGGFFAGMDTILGVDGWRWVFLVNMPIGVIALFVVARVLNVPHNKVGHRIDYWGAAALTVGLVPLLIVTQEGSIWGWGSAQSLLTYVVGLLGLVAFVLIEIKMGDEALLPMRLFRSRSFSVANAATFTMGIGMFGGMMSLPLYLQIVKGATPTESGLMTLPMTFGILVASTVSGIATSKTGRYKVFPIAGLGAMACALFLFGQINTATPLWQTMLIMVLMGAGLGLCMQTLVLAIQNDVPITDIGAGTSSAIFLRSIGGTVGTAVFLSILFNTAPTRIAEARAAAGLPVPTVEGAGLDLNDTSFLQLLDPANKTPILDGFSSAIDTVFVVGGFITLGAFALAWFIRESRMSAIRPTGVPGSVEEKSAVVAN
jgi:EmrB/QacA subfamily drug resistance transporter